MKKGTDVIEGKAFASGASVSPLPLLGHQPGTGWGWLSPAPLCGSPVLQTLLFLAVSVS